MIGDCARVANDLDVLKVNTSGEGRTLREGKRDCDACARETEEVKYPEEYHTSIESLSYKLRLAKKLELIWACDQRDGNRVYRRIAPALFVHEKSNFGFAYE